MVRNHIWGGTVGGPILKNRLYDIDVVISRTVVFAGLAAFITAIYVGIVVGVGSLVGAGGEPNLCLSIVATAVVAVAFQPVRERLTRLANRLVFGKRATPYEVLSRFSDTLFPCTKPPLRVPSPPPTPSSPSATGRTCSSTPASPPSFSRAEANATTTPSRPATSVTSP